MTHAEYGTAVHALAEKCLKTGEAPKEYVGKTLAGVEITERMASSVSLGTWPFSSTILKRPN